MKELVCIVCPRGCTMTLEGEGKDVKVSGNSCKRGAAFAVSEMTEPKRTICSTVRTAFPDVPVLPVRVSKEIPKDRIFDVMAEINKVTVKKKVKRGEVIIKDVLGLGADIIATSGVLDE
ncbi:MAG: DUF1667 domain-containing protein [Oscillospiraceae bacterium]|nr:DUF1667 domain-containing protein [Oscillospiraceae bacterium]